MALRKVARNHGSSLSFNGLNTYVSRNAGSVYGSTGYSVALWMKGGVQSANDKRIYAEGSSTTANPIFSLGTKQVADKKLCVFVRNDTGTVGLGVSGTLSATDVLDNQWHHIVWTDNNGTTALYIDGVLDATNFNYTPSGTYTLDRTAVGTLLRSAPGNYFLGNIDSVRTYSRVLTAQEAKDMYTADVRSSTNLFFEWLFNEGTGTTTADTSGNNNTGTITGATWSTDVPGAARQVVRNFGSTLSFGGSTDVQTTTVTNLKVSGASFAAWVKPTVFNTTQRIMYYAGGGYRLFLGTNTIGFGVFNVGSGWQDNQYTVPANVGTWFHAAGVYDPVAGKAYVYCNGQLVGSGTVANTPSFNVTKLAVGSTGNLAEYYRGNMAQFVAYMNVLSSSDIASLYNTGTTSYTPALLWPLNEATGTTATDTSGNGNTGTINGASWSGDVPMAARTVAVDNKASLLFNGSTGKVALTNNVLFGVTSNFSLGCWTKVTARTGGFQTFMATDNYGLRVNDIGQLWFTTFSVKDYTDSSTFRMRTGIWYHYMVTLDSSYTARFYINGQLTSAVTGSSAANSTLSALWIGARNNTEYTQGMVTMAQLYNTALSAAQIAQLYQTGAAPTTRLLDMPLQEGAGTTAQDTSGNGNSGTITGALFTDDVPTKKRKVVGDNLVFNGDFSIIPVVNNPQRGNGVWVDGSAGATSQNTSQANIFGWKTYTGFSTSGTVFYDTTEKNSGVASFCINLPDAGFIECDSSLTTALGLRRDYIKVLPNTAYTGSYYMKTQYISGDSNSGANLNFMEVDGSGGDIVGRNGGGIKTTTPWTKYTVNFTTGATTRFIRVNPLIYGHTGVGTLAIKAWYDDIELRPTTNTTRQIA